MGDPVQRIIEIADSIFSLRLQNTVIPRLSGGTAKLSIKCAAAASSMRRPFNVIVPSVIRPTAFQFSQAQLQTVRGATNNVLAAISEIDSFVARAKAAGFAPPDNPIQKILAFNEGRILQRVGTSDVLEIVPQSLDTKLAGDLLFNLNVLLDLMSQEKAGSLSLTRRPSSAAAQISSYEISMSGFDMGSSGGGQTDVLGFLVDTDLIQRRRARDAAGILDFRARRPKILLTMDYRPDGFSRGCIVVWKRMPDASSYFLTRHSIFENRDVIFDLQNSVLPSELAKIKGYVEEWGLSFYDGVTSDEVWAFLDTTVEPDQYYTYVLQATQAARTDRGFLFAADRSPLVMSSIQLNDVAADMATFVSGSLSKRFSEATIDDVNPYPFISRRIYGHDKNDWLIAAANVGAAIDRNEDRTSVRNFSYLGARFSFLKEKILAGKAVRPTSVDTIRQSIVGSIASRGISRTLADVVEGTGLDVFFGASEDPSGNFRRAGSLFVGGYQGDLLSIFSAVDPETATVDIRVLMNNLADVLSHVDPSVESSRQVDSPGEASQSDDVTQFVADLGSRNDFLDLTTFEGISDFVRVIRLFFDANPTIQRPVQKPSTAPLPAPPVQQIPTPPSPSLPPPAPPRQTPLPPSGGGFQQGGGYTGGGRYNPANRRR